MHETGALWVNGPHVKMSSSEEWMHVHGEEAGGNLNKPERDEACGIDRKKAKI